MSVYVKFTFLSVLGCCSLHLIYEDFSVIFWSVHFLGLVVYDLWMKAVSLRNIVIVLSTGDD